MEPSQPVERSRRAILFGAVGGAVGLIAAALGRPAPAAAVGETMTVGGNFPNATSTTYLGNSSGNGNAVLQVSTSGTGTAVFGISHGAGLYGQTYGARGVGVFGYTPGGGGSDVAIQGTAYNDSTGVVGSSSTLPAGAPRPRKTGVYGWAVQDASARGVWGHSAAGRGVFGEATSGLGVRGFATSGVGLSGEATMGYALRTKGRVRLDESAGLATLAVGRSSVTVTPGIDITSTSAVLATINGNPGGTIAVRRVTVNLTANTFTVYLTGTATAAARIAWLIVG